MATVAFWAAAVLLAQTYFLYPLWLLLLARLRPAPRGVPSRTQPWPAVSLVVAAYDEASCIEEKLRNSLPLDYPPDRLRGAHRLGRLHRRDRCARARYTDPRVRLSAAPRAGKTSVLNRCIPAARGDIVVLSDANTRIEPEAVKALVRHFEDPRVGGGLRAAPALQPHPGRVRGERLLDVRVRLIKLSRASGERWWGPTAGSTPSAAAFTALPPSTIVDDFVIPLRILDQGYRVLYEPEAVASEETTEDYGKEFGRRARIAAGNFQSLGLVPGLLSPLRGFPAFAFWSHKVLRWCAPALMLVALVANLLLLDQPFYRVTLAAQVLFYALAMLGKRRWGRRASPRRVASCLLLRDHEPGDRGRLLAIPAKLAGRRVGAHRARVKTRPRRGCRACVSRAASTSRSPRRWTTPARDSGGCPSRRPGTARSRRRRGARC